MTLVISDTDSVIGKVCGLVRILTPTGLAAHRQGSARRDQPRDALQGLLLAGIELQKPQPLVSTTVGGNKIAALVGTRLPPLPTCGPRSVVLFESSAPSEGFVDRRQRLKPRCTEKDLDAG